MINTFVMSDLPTSCDSDDDVPTLPADTIAILQEFYQEQNEKSKKEEQGEIDEDWVSMVLVWCQHEP